MVLGDGERDLSALVVPRIGGLRETGDPWEPYQLYDAGGAVVAPVSVFLKDLQAAARPAATQHSYAMDLLRWFRFCWAVSVPWNQATRAEARDFSRWIQVGDKTVSRTAALRPGTVNAVTGKASPGRGYASATVLHSETVLRGFYEFHLQAGTGPIVNPCPLVRRRRAHAHHHPMGPCLNGRGRRYQPSLARRLP